MAFELSEYFYSEIYIAALNQSLYESANNYRIIILKTLKLWKFKIQLVRVTNSIYLVLRGLKYILHIKMKFQHTLSAVDNVVFA